ncbi:MAG: copper chaperone PCu(A)C [Hyphomicrobium sp.]|nr:copper chaperone PCu(A)C [Hyphomicrobium sp.]
MRVTSPVLGLLAVLAFAGPGVAHEVTNKGVTVAHPWARATPGGATVGAAFMEIRTGAGVTDRLVSASSPVAGRVEVHTHIMEGGVMKMRRVDALELKPGESRILKPMGDHVMFFDLKQPLKEGDLVKIQLNFAKAGMLEVEGSVEPAGAMGPHGMPSQPVEAGKGGAENSGHDHKHH